MAAVSLDTDRDSFDYGNCNVTKNCIVINAFCGILNSQKYFISCVNLAITHHVSHVSPHMEI